MKPDTRTIRQVKQMYRSINLNKNDPTKRALIKQLKSEIKFNFKLYGIESGEQFAKKYSFCIDCGKSLNQDNECTSCGRAYGW